MMNKFVALYTLGATLCLSACVQPIDSNTSSGNSVTSTFHLNDSGITSYLQDTTFPSRALNTAAPSPNTTTTAPSTLPGQDASYGYDAAATKTDADGANGFQFVKLDNSGVSLTNQAATYGTTPWACVYDKVTGLTWEVKTTSGLQYYSQYYTWYNSNSTNNGGNAGAIGDASTCTGLTNCNTEEYIKAINGNTLCGYTNWRLPTREELRSLVDYSKAASAMMIDTNFFPNTLATDHWAAETAYYADPDNSYAWELHFNAGYSEAHPKSSQNVAVRLVRGPS